MGYTNLIVFRQNVTFHSSPPPIMTALTDLRWRRRPVRLVLRRSSRQSSQRLTRTPRPGVTVRSLHEMPLVHAMILLMLMRRMMAVAARVLRGGGHSLGLLLR
jgi:hypothetical protein